MSLILAHNISWSAPLPKAEAKTAWIVVTLADNELYLSKDAGKTFDKLMLEKESPHIIRAMISPDHARLILLTRDKINDTNISVAVAKLGKADFPLKIKSIAEFQHIIHLIPFENGNEVYVSGLNVSQSNQPNILRHQCWESSRLNLDTSKRTDLPVSGEYRIWSSIPDSEDVLAIRTANLKARGNGIRGPEISLVRSKAVKLDAKVLITPELDFSPLIHLGDGERVLVSTPKAEIGVYDFSKNELKLWKDGDASKYRMFQFDPTSKRLFHVGYSPKSTNGELFQISTDGTNQTKLKSFEKLIRWIDVR